MREELLREARTEDTSPWFGKDDFGNERPTPRRLPKVSRTPEEELEDELGMAALDAFDEWSEGLEQSTGADVFAASSDAFLIEEEDFVVEAIALDKASISDELVIADFIDIDEEESTNRPFRSDVNLRFDDEFAPPETIHAPVPEGPSMRAPQPEERKTAEELRRDIMRLRNTGVTTVKDATAPEVDESQPKILIDLPDEELPSVMVMDGTLEYESEPAPVLLTNVVSEPESTDLDFVDEILVTETTAEQVEHFSMRRRTTRTAGFAVGAAMLTTGMFAFVTGTEPLVTIALVTGAVLVGVVSMFA